MNQTNTTKCLSLQIDVWKWGYFWDELLKFSQLYLLTWFESVDIHSSNKIPPVQIFCLKIDILKNFDFIPEKTSIKKRYDFVMFFKSSSPNCLIWKFSTVIIITFFLKNGIHIFEMLRQVKRSPVASILITNVARMIC